MAERKEDIELTVAGAGGAASGEAPAKPAAGKDEVAEEVKPRGPPPLAYHKLFRYSTCTDHVILFIGIIASMALGVTMPAFSIIFGDLLDTLNSPDDFQSEVDDLALTFVIVGLIAFVCAMGEITLMNISAARQVKVARTLYFRSVLRQDIGWFDITSAGDVSTRLAENCISLNAGMGQKLGNIAHNAATFIGGLVVGFIFSWDMTLIVLAFLPFMGGSVWALTSFVTKFDKETKEAYADAGAVAEESITNMQTVTCHNAQDAEVEKYSSHLKAAEHSAIKKGRVGGLSMGAMYFFIFCVYGVGLWYGGVLVRDSNEDDPRCINDPAVADCFTGGDVMLVFFAVIMAAFSIGQVGPAISAISAARAAGARIFEVIDRVPVIDSLSKEGKQVSSVTGHISFKNITFKYPSRPKQTILKDFSLDVSPGETVAFVGESGSGKSTLIALLQRFYDPNEGSIEIDGVPLTDLNLTSFRNHIGIVSQEPTLFDNTIEQNIRFGVPEGRDVTREQVEQAARMANAHGFISQLDAKYETRVGERGTQLSGGQKQRIAIARAIIRNPDILLLDEATSALDSRSEKIVQKALDELLSRSKNRTTFVIAHRLSTVSNVDRIVVLDHGSIVETGSPTELMGRPGGYFARMLAMQNLTANDQEEDDGAGVDAAADKIDEDGLESPQPRRSRGESAVGATAVVEDEEAADDKDKKKKKKKKGPEFNEDFVDVGFMDVWRFQKQEYPILAGGMFVAMINGSVMPLFSIIFTEILDVFFANVTDGGGTTSVTLTNDKIKDDTLVLMGLFIALAVVSGLCYLLQPWLFTIAGERLTTRLRQEAFKSLMKQEPGYYDDAKHNVGVLTTRLSTDASLIQLTTGQKLGLTIQNNVALVTALIIAFISSWRLSLVVLGTMPFMMMAGLAMMKFAFGGDKDTSFTRAGAISSEAIHGIRTVTSLGLQNRVESSFSDALAEGNKAASRQHWFAGFFFGISQFVMFATYAICFWAGSKFIDEGYIEFDDMIRVFFALSMASWSVGENAQHAGDQKAADNAKRSVFAIIRRESRIDPTNPSGLSPPSCQGHIEFRDVNFRYPTRKNILALKGVSFDVAAGSVVAFVGASGCGKSTVIRLLQRLYTPESGSILLDGTPIDQLNIKWLRNQFGFVQQEPALFNDTLEYNIAYARDDIRPKPTSPGLTLTASRTDADVPAEIVEAARSANATNFIEGFPTQYNTRAGSGGNQLSGGQKQRIAIARAIIANPNILLLDEATSALDSESEAIVQAALDKLMKDQRGKRTTLVIAHRLSTIKSADMIVVMNRGEVVEVGNHSTLLRNPTGRYSQLVKAQGTTSATEAKAE